VDLETQTKNETYQKKEAVLPSFKTFQKEEK